MADNYISLKQLNSHIQDVIKSNLEYSYLVACEIAELNENRSGHCYLQLVEKDEDSDRVIAANRAIIWANNYRLISAYFESVTGQSFAVGMKVLFAVSVDYHELYGLNLNIHDVEPKFTLGDIEQRRRAIIEQLEEEGIINMNKELEYPIVPQKIAIISSPTAAGYEDFVNQLENNQYGFKFYHKLFAAYMQGDKAGESIMNALDSIYEYESVFDLVVIIRGGGSKIDLSAFDKYEPASYIAQFPLPVISGIGHQKDESVIDLVSYSAVKTPTAAAALIIDKIIEVDTYLDDSLSYFAGFFADNIAIEQEKLSDIIKSITTTVDNITVNENYRLKLLVKSIPLQMSLSVGKEHDYLKYKKDSVFKAAKEHVKNSVLNVNQNTALLHREIALKISACEDKIRNIETVAKLVDPRNLLEKGYSITSVNGVVVKSKKSIKKGQLIETGFIDGKVTSEVK